MRRILVAALVILISFLLSEQWAEAEQTEISLQSIQTEEGLNRYENPYGTGFETNLIDGDTEAYMAIFEFDEGVVWKLIKDGSVIPYNSEDFITEAGSYSLMVTFQDMPDAYATFHFRIAASAENEFGSFDFGEIIENPKLDVTFDERRQMFRYRLPNGAVFYSSVPQGGIAAMRANFEFSSEYSITAKKDGSTITYDMEHGFSEPGVYTLRIVRNSAYESSEADNDTYIVNFTFRVITGSVSSLTVVSAPEDFVIREIWLNEHKQELQSNTWHWLGADGIYECIFVGENDSSLFYSISFRKDTVAPFLIFSEGAFEENTQMVQYTPREEGCTIVVTRDGEFYTPAANTLAVGGRYRISVSDNAGNVRTYTVRVQQEIKVFDYKLIILLAVVLLVLGGYLIYTRNNMRVL